MVGTTKTHFGLSLKRSTVADQLAMRQEIWRFYQNKKTDTVSVPAQFLLPLDRAAAANLVALEDAALSTLAESTAFKKLGAFTKLPRQGFRTLHVLDDAQTTRPGRLLHGENILLNATTFSTKRQLNQLSPLSAGLNHRLALDQRSFSHFLEATRRVTPLQSVVREAGPQAAAVL